jgi:hypothetical protein
MDDDGENAIVEQGKRELVALVFSVAGTLITMYIVMNYSTSSMQAFRMRVALKVKHFAEKQADYWHDVAGKAASAYNREKN